MQYTTLTHMCLHMRAGLRTTSAKHLQQGAPAGSNAQPLPHVLHICVHTRVQGYVQQLQNTYSRAPLLVLMHSHFLTSYSSKEIGISSNSVSLSAVKRLHPMNVPVVITTANSKVSREAVEDDGEKLLDSRFGHNTNSKVSKEAVENDGEKLLDSRSPSRRQTPR